MKMLEKMLLCVSLPGFALILFFGVFGENGLLDLMALRRLETSWLEANERLERQNKNLTRQIERLKHDPAYIEHIARREIGMIGRDEIIVRINPSEDAPPETARGEEP